MKKQLLFIFASLTMAISAQAQSTSTSELSIGAEGALPLGDFSETHKFGYGGTIKYAYNLNENMAVTAKAGYLSFKGKDIDYGSYWENAHIIPVLFGFRYTLDNSNFYLEPALGAASTSIGDLSKTNFAYELNLGIRTLPGLDLSAHISRTSNDDGGITWAGIRVAYAFPIGSSSIKTSSNLKSSTSSVAKPTKKSSETNISDASEDIKKLKSLLDSGAITKEEYESQKKKILEKL